MFGDGAYLLFMSFHQISFLVINSAQYPGPKGPATPSGVASGHCYDQHMCEIINPVATLFSYPVLCFPIPFTRA